MEIVLPYLFGLFVAAVLLKVLWPKRRQRTRYSAHAVAREVEGRLYDEQQEPSQLAKPSDHDDDDDVWDWPDLDDWDDYEPARSEPARRRDAA